MAHHARSGVSVGRAAISASASNNRYYITKITCNEFLADQLTDSRSLAIWLNGYVNGARGKTLIDPLSAGHSNLIHYCLSHIDTLILDAARNVYGADK